MASKRSAAADELRVLSDDLRSLGTTLTSDPKELARKQRRWRLLYGGLSAVGALLARRATIKVWGVLTGEQPPNKRNTGKP